MYKTILTYCFWALAFFSSMGSHAQQVLPIEICENCLKEVFENTFTATKEALASTNKDFAEFRIKVSSTEEQKGLLYVGDSEYISIFTDSDTLKAGKFAPKITLKAPFARYLIPVSLKIGDNNFLVKMTQNDGKYFTVAPKLILGSDIEDAIPLYYSQNENARMVNVICVLLLFFLLLFSFYQAKALKNRAFKVYGYYLMSILLFLFFFSDEYLQWHFTLPNHLEHYGTLNILLQGIVYVVYTEFGLVLLDIRKRDKWLFKISRLFQILTVVITSIHALYLFSSGGDQYFIFKHFYKVYFLLTIVSSYMTYYIIFKFKDPLKWFLIIGGIVIGGAVANELINIFIKGIPKARDFYYTLPNGLLHFSFLEISYVLECLIFLMGINFKNVRQSRENISLKEKVIAQLLDKERLEKQVNELLSDRLEKSEKRLAFEKVSSENERNKAELMQSQLNSLQLQMNPHYLFNSLNSINDFIISKKPQEASEYLALYARMMRNILKSSDKTFNTLEQELEFSEDYLQLESLRFENRFDYKIIRPQNSANSEMIIPGMMLQPILENAVWHGMMPLKQKGEIILDASQSDKNKVIIEVSDNGFGILESKGKSKKDSYGLKIIQDKIELLDKLYGEKISFEMINKPNGRGFKVRFVFPEMHVEKTEL